MINQKLRTMVGQDIASIFIDSPWVVGVGVGFNGQEDVISVATKDRTKTLHECVPETWLQFPVILHYDTFATPDSTAPDLPEEILFE